MDRSQEDAILELAVERGLLTRSDLVDGMPTEQGWAPLAGGERLAHLLRAGRLQKEALDILLSQAQNGATLPAVPKAAPEWAIPTSLGRYRIEAFLGAGGMGRVYRAYDPGLQRAVALKLLQADDRDSIERFLHEARAQARVDHPFVCKVYEAGELEGRPYIAMQLLAGLPLDEIASRLSLREKVRLMRQVADAVEASHRTGLIHRDLKPSNILVERTAEGAWRPYVLDFGVARDMAGPGLTLTGIPVGTPQFMAPEQATGKSAGLDGRTDVYGLGATLYAALSGHAPFEGGNVELLVRILHEDPRPLHTLTSVPRDLGLIVAKCLAKEPERRYPSAHELALDLQRFVDGEPVAARAPTLVDRLMKRARRHRVATSVAVAAALLLVAIGALSLREAWRARRQAQLAYQFGAEVQEIENVLPTAFLLPRHDVRKEKALIRARLAAIGAAAARVGEVAYGPAQDALGRGHLALQEYELARQALEHAWASGYHTPAVATALGECLGALYRQALEEADQLRSPELRSARRAEVARSLRDPALSYLRATNRAGSSAYVEGLVAFYSDHRAEAIARARTAFAASPTLYQAEQLEGDVLAAEAHDRLARGDYRGAQLQLAAAGEAYRKALEIGRSDPEVYLAEGRRLLTAVEVGIQTGHFQGPLFSEALQAFAAAAAIDPDRSTPWSEAARLHWLHGEYASVHGANPSAPLAAAIASAAAATARNPADALAWYNGGVARELWAEWQVAHGQDPRPAVARASVDFDRAMARRPNFAAAADSLGLAYTTQAQYETTVGLNPTASLELAISSYQRALRSNPTFSVAFNNLALAYQSRALYEMRIGVDPHPSLLRAGFYFDRALALNPNFALALSNDGAVLLYLSDLEQQAGRDPLRLVGQAVEKLRRSLAINPRDSITFANLAAASELRAQEELIQGLDAGASLELGRQALRAALAANPNDGLAVASWGALDRLAAEDQLRHGRDASTSLAEARRWFGRATELNRPITETIRPELVRLEVIAARDRWRRGLDAEPAFAAALRQLTPALRGATPSLELLTVGAELFFFRSEWRAAQGEDPADDVRQGTLVADRALAANPSLAVVVALKGALRLVASRAGGSESTRLAAGSAQLLRRALQASPRLAHDYSPLLAEARRSAMPRSASLEMRPKGGGVW